MISLMIIFFKILVVSFLFFTQSIFSIEKTETLHRVLPPPSLSNFQIPVFNKSCKSCETKLAKKLSKLSFIKPQKQYPKGFLIDLKRNFLTIFVKDKVYVNFTKLFNLLQKFGLVVDHLYLKIEGKIINEKSNLILLSSARKTIFYLDSSENLTQNIKKYINKNVTIIGYIHRKEKIKTKKGYILNVALIQN